MDRPIQEQRPIKIFISYSHRDSKWREELTPHLDELRQYFHLDIWHDGEIPPGSNWKGAIDQSVQSTDVAILLVSANFLASEFIRKNELQPFLQAGALILPIIAGHCLYEKIPGLSQLQSVNDPTRPLSKLSKAKREEVFTRMATQILSFIEKNQGRLGEETQRPETDASQKRSQEEVKENAGGAKTSVLNEDHVKNKRRKSTQTPWKSVSVIGLIIAAAIVSILVINQFRRNGNGARPDGTTVINAAKGEDASFGDLKIKLLETRYDPTLGKYLVTAEIALPGHEPVKIDGAEEDMSYTYPADGLYSIMVKNANEKSAVFWISQANR